MKERVTRDGAADLLDAEHQAAKKMLTDPVDWCGDGAPTSLITQIEQGSFYPQVQRTVGDDTKDGSAGAEPAL